ncbi:MAG: hypothetical protein PW792_02640 [Acidobacteriaceae bacterium]|nr:hypothetical protein [Acidobacteriaceae bacterium]
MQRYLFQQGELRTPQPMWLRCLTMFALVMIAVIGTVQAVHIHGDLLPHAKAELHAPALSSQMLGGEERCPLCVGMHMTMPTRAIQYMVVELLAPTLLVEQATIRRATLWHSAWWSRPPPVQAS